MGYESKVNPAVAFPDAEIADEVWSEYTNDPLYLGYVKDGPLDWERLTHLKGYVCFNYSSMNDADSYQGWTKWYEADFPDKRTAVCELLEKTAEAMDAPFVRQMMTIGEALEDCEESVG